MSNIELSDIQWRIITTLVNQYQQSDAPVKSNQIAAAIDRNSGTVRNQMGNLTALDLVDGVPGPTGGYEPTENAFEVLGRENLDEGETITLSQDYERVAVTVDEIEFPNVYHPEECTARVHFQHSARQIDVGDPVAVGPTPLSNLVVVGLVEAINDTADEILLDIAKIESPLTNE